MARKKVATLKKRDKKRPMAYVDKKGNVRHFARGKKSTLLEKNVVSKELLKKRRAKGKKGILLFVKGKGVYQTARKLRGRKRKGKKARRRARVKKLRKSRRCPKTRKSRSLRAAKACIRAGKGRTSAKKRVFNLAVRRLRKSKAGRAWLKAHGVKKAKGVRRKARRSRR